MGGSFSFARFPEFLRPCPFDGAPVMNVDSQDLLQKKAAADLLRTLCHPPSSGAFRQFQMNLSKGAGSWRVVNIC